MEDEEYGPGGRFFLTMEEWDFLNTPEMRAKVWATVSTVLPIAPAPVYETWGDDSTPQIGWVFEDGRWAADDHALLRALLDNPEDLDLEVAAVIAAQEEQP